MTTSDRGQNTEKIFFLLRPFPDAERRYKKKNELVTVSHKFKCVVENVSHECDGEPVIRPYIHPPLFIDNNYLYQVTNRKCVSLFLHQDRGFYYP